MRKRRGPFIQVSCGLVIAARRAAGPEVRDGGGPGPSRGSDPDTEQRTRPARADSEPGPGSAVKCSGRPGRRRQEGRKRTRRRGLGLQAKLRGLRGAEAPGWRLGEGPEMARWLSLLGEGPGGAKGPPAGSQAGRGGWERLDSARARPGDSKPGGAGEGPQDLSRRVGD